MMLFMLGTAAALWAALTVLFLSIEGILRLRSKK
jgi:hypothetical protein